MPDIIQDGHTTLPTEPGWYHDPEGRYSHQAYWDGEKWTGATREGRKESRKARERRFVKTWTGVGIALGITLLIFWWLGTPSDRVGSTSHLLTEHGITFSVPTGWTEMFVDQPNAQRWTYAVSPDHVSNWVLLTYVPDPEPGTSAAPDGIGLIMDDLESRSFEITAGPTEVTVAGLQGFELTITGIAGERTGKDLAGKTVLLYGESATYKFDAQWDAEHESNVRAALDEILTSLSVT